MFAIFCDLQKNLSHSRSLLGTTPYSYSPLGLLWYNYSINLDFNTIYNLVNGVTTQFNTDSDALNFLITKYDDKKFGGLFQQNLEITKFYIYDSTTDTSVDCDKKYLAGLQNISINYIIPQQSNQVIDDIDYDTPGEVLKAYRAGKTVDWSSVAKKRF